MNREKVLLTKEQETLLIPLHAKAQETSYFQDEKARQILEGVQYDFRALRIPEKTAVTLRMRASKIDACTRAFLQQQPHALVLHLGCGLDSRCLRVLHPQACWIDLDMPDVIELRRKFYSETETYRMIASSVTDLSWTDVVPQEKRPVFVIAEGLLMYLHEEDVQSLFLHLRECFPGCQIVFDAFSKMTVERIKAHPSLQKTGASIHWGIDDPKEIEGWADGIHLVEEWFFSQSPDIQQMSWFWRFMFWVTSGISAAQKAQRILTIQL